MAAIVLPCARARAAPNNVATASYVGSLDPNELSSSAPFWRRSPTSIRATLRRFKRSQASRNDFISSALNDLNQGVLMTDPDGAVEFCKERYRDIYGLSRSELPPDMTARSCSTCGARADYLMAGMWSWPPSRKD